jgi:Ca2+-binding EF-hand superfamily protein
MTLGLAAVLCIAIAGARSQQNQNTGKNPATDKNPTADKNKTTDGQNAPRFDAARFLKDHDKNNDGKLSKDELPSSAQKEFESIDTNKDGFISQDELQQHAAHMAKMRPQLVEVVYYTIDLHEEPTSLQELQTAYDELRKMDKNNDGKLDDSEVKMFRESRRKERIDGIVSALDRNKDGKISKDEARGLWADNFSQLDKNNDGFLDHQEIEAALAFKQGANQQQQPNK